MPITKITASILLALIFTPVANTSHNITPFTQKEFKCLVDNVYHEARGEPKEGILLVAKTTLNRAKSGIFPKSICEVVYQPYQFSWTIYKRKLPIDKEQWNRLAGIVHESIEHPADSLYFHATYIKTPKWAKNKEGVVVGKHKFY